ncbi:MAG: hypothetical protein JXO72_05035 [Vicinamibacteria bacterium]|nr:hypothetical protein [Vicinamibacteria bacterium]
MSVDVFESATLAGVRLKNRVIRSATHGGLADAQGFPLPVMEWKYAHLARGGAGLIITGYAGVQPNGRCHFPGMLMIDRDACIDPARRLVDAVHALDTPIVLQLGHCGRQTRRQAIGETPVAPSAVRDRHYNGETRCLNCSFCAVGLDVEPARCHFGRIKGRYDHGT